tara:strand:+ start:751 stop:1173 length:423 start_codon:yes stop_codon:yes gene_type:complete
MSPADRLAQLSGKWQVARVIRHADGTTARFSGTADWSPDATGLRCDEIGSLTIGAMAPVSGNRTTLWQARDNAIAVAFADARPFHVIGPGPRPAATHDCTPDTYCLTYDFTLWPRWSVRWHVIGPRKDYRALTRYSRLNY